ncbi:hypothetical protein HUO09_17540 [Vibrio sp. Y2-5]|uniref:hypothetical protein n=1 Tax=Vibrio sp. Y2-5 TaxID=2743977 RepID=UPI001660C075|nr:hypothetical protein [Vibrio sp. Y2-5]MBD0788161.1 hypothetical protein [Vibrio sp. Y2-5]
MMEELLAPFTSELISLVPASIQQALIDVHHLRTAFLEGFIATLIFILVLFILKDLIGWIRSLLFPYPETIWGFRGKLLYVDNKVDTIIFRNDRFKVSCNPDSIYRLNNNKYAYIEGKSRPSLRDSDIVQLEVGILALRGTYNVTAGAIILSNGTIHWVEGAADSSRKLFKRNKEYIMKARLMKQGKLNVKPVRKEECNLCPMAKNCWGK